MLKDSTRAYEILASNEKKLRSLLMRLELHARTEKRPSDELIATLSRRKGSLITVGDYEYVVHTVRALQAYQLTPIEAFESGLIKELPSGWANGLTEEQIFNAVAEIYLTYNRSNERPLYGWDWCILVGVKPACETCATRN